MCVRMSDCVGGWEGGGTMKKTSPGKKYHINLRQKTANLPDSNNIKA